jgi:hypothetical protein
MTDNRDLRVEVQGANIVVSLPGTDCTVTYKKWTDLPQLVLTYSSSDTSVSASIASEFRMRAFQAAVDKARALGWIV